MKFASSDISCYIEIELWRIYNNLIVFLNDDRGDGVLYVSLLFCVHLNDFNKSE